MPANRSKIARAQVFWSGIVYTAVCLGVIMGNLVFVGAKAIGI